MRRCRAVQPLARILCLQRFQRTDFHKTVQIEDLERFQMCIRDRATAAIMNASVALIAAFFQGEKQLKMIAMQGMSMEFGGVIFLSISGVLADVSWRSPFYIYGLGFLALLMLLLFIPKSGRAAMEDGAGEELSLIHILKRSPPWARLRRIIFRHKSVKFTFLFACRMWIWPRP